jgi:hypothetical protein
MKNIAKQPWHVYKGGNFTCVVAEGYEEWVEKHSYIAGPFLVCQVDSEDSDHNTRSMRQCQKIAAQICNEHNYALNYGIKRLGV